MSVNNGVIFPVIGVVFVVLKLTDQIDWSWTIVLSPFWGPIVLVLVLIFMGLSLMGIIGLFSLIGNATGRGK